MAARSKNRRKAKGYNGLCKSICGGWYNLRHRTDFNGKTKLMPGRIMVMLVCTGALLGAVGIYGPFSKWAGAGANVPLLGFGNVLWKGVKEAVDSEGFVGLFKGGFKACAVGVSAALIFSYIAALITKPKLKS